MSRNFELIQRAGKGQSLFDGSALRETTPIDADRRWDRVDNLETGFGSASTAATRRLHLDIEGLGREESLKFVRRVFLSQEPDAARSVVFVGAERAVGSTWNCMCAARTLAAQVSGKVCVVDANFRHPALHKFFAVENTGGLAAAVTQAAPIGDFLIQVGDSNLWLLPSGTSCSDLSKYCTPLDMEKRLTELRDQFDYVLIDAPAANQYADALALGSMTDGVVLVVESDSTHRDAARQAAYNLRAARVRTIGAILNKRTYPVPKFIYRMLR
jgi:Mrp family chromosome partitioning ATPase